MPAIQNMNTQTTEPSAHSPATVSPQILLLLSVATGVSVASLYYSQPMLGTLGSELHANERLTGLVPTLTQLG